MIPVLMEVEPLPLISSEVFQPLVSNLIATVEVLIPVGLQLFGFMLAVKVFPKLIQRFAK